MAGLNTMRTPFYVSISATLALLVVAAGCSQTETSFHPVSGSVKTSSGRNCDGALVVFHPQSSDLDSDPRPSATCDHQGNFSLTTRTMGDGAKPGRYNVTVVWFGKPSSKTMSLSSESSPRHDLLKGRYGDPNHAKLTAVVDSDSESQFEFVVQ